MPSLLAPVVAAVAHRGWVTVVEYAAAEALRRGRPVHLVHADGVAEGPGLGAALLERATRFAHELVDGQAAVISTLAAEPPVRAVAAMADAALVVVGRSARTRHPHPYARSVTGGIGARVCAPVVSVPEEWERPFGPQRVVVGIDDPDRALDVLSAGLDAARARGARLEVLSARPTRATDLGEEARLEAALSAAVDRLRPTYDPADLTAPDVPVRVVVRRAPPGEALLEAAEGASLVVLGRHVTSLPAGSHLGPVARSVVSEALCPVLLAAPAARPAVEHHWVEPAGMRS